MSGNLICLPAPEDTGLVLLVDDDITVAHSERRALEAIGHQVLEAASGAEALALMSHHAVDLILLDIGLPDMSGLALLQKLRDISPEVAVVVQTGSDNLSHLWTVLTGAVDAYLHKPIDLLALQAQVTTTIGQRRFKRAAQVKRETLRLELAVAREELEQLPLRMATSFSAAWDLRHVETGEHVRRIGLYTEILARAVDKPAPEAELLGRIATLHDIGKIAIPDHILNKPGPLSAAEFELMKVHTSYGAQLLRGLRHPLFERAAVVAVSHHERWDGSGYPAALAGEACPLDARIVAIVDVYDALSQSRCYKEAWDEERVLQYFQWQRGKQFQAELVDALLAVLPELRAIGRNLPEPISNSTPPDAMSGVYAQAAPSAASEFGEADSTPKG
ncbi:MAG TPA: HD domain-containing phosphohydrolase, partial [Polyangiaceae bacterium]|nr:HD domain-containing phosphohydrolase [Polyangiaceae bacterium]